MVPPDGPDEHLQHLGLIVSDFLYLEGQRDRGPVMAFIRCDRGSQPTDHHTLAMVLHPEPGYVHSAYGVADLDALAAGGQYLPDGARWDAACPVTYAEVAGLVTRTANLLASLGVRRTDVVGLLSPNTAELVLALLTGQAAGIAPRSTRPSASTRSPSCCAVPASASWWRPVRNCSRRSGGSPATSPPPSA